MPTINKLPKKKRQTENSEKRTERKKWYNNTRWRKLRLQKLQDQPLCEECLKNGEKVTAAVDIHHIISFMSTDNEELKYQLFYDYSNLMSLCKECHQKIHNPAKK
ncbi:HNH endonuclease signature motif containing protein [uncultured Bacteroides sp.]|uniref:HNH endonuclease signature motif containing protein n=1 Tax=uncultured Bacteroides sp. TaxID=162156 RepID=UPI002AA89E98|nr:HNH endonuclease signature motif containing protein [uncultured Bacteroides sp.]